MRWRFLYMLITAPLLLCLCPVRAATEQWSYPTSNYVFQIYADGKGGCAFIQAGVPPVAELVWLDKKGTLIGQTVVSNVSAGGIVECSKKHVVFADQWAGTIVLQWDAGGTPSQAPAAAGTYNSVLSFVPLPRDVSTDAKGFFAVRTNITTGAGAIVRYSYK